MALDVECVVDGGVNAQETLGGSGRFETLHLALAPSCRLMRILGPVVCAQAPVMASRQSNFGLRRAVRAQLVRYQHLGCKALFLKQLAHSFTAAALSRRRCTRRSRTSPSSSIARHSQNRRPAIITAISSRCHRAVGRGRRRRSSLANNGPNFKTHRRTVS
jgi:hypothetical protein